MEEWGLYVSILDGSKSASWWYDLSEASSSICKPSIDKQFKYDKKIGNKRTKSEYSL